MLYIIYTKYEITSRIVKTIENKNSTIKSIEIPLTTKRYYLQKITSKLNQLFKTTFFTKFIYSTSTNLLIKEILPSDKILFWDYYYYDEIKYILKKKKIPSSSASLWIWNTINLYHLKTLNLIKQTGIKIYTFDPLDSIKYNLGLLNQVHYKEDLIQKKIKYDFFFIGMDKGRSKTLNDLSLFLEEKGYTYKFIIVKTKDENSYRYNKIDYINQPIPYNNILEFISESQIIVDITQSNQTGITLRTLEALFYRKKLLTNNPNIINMDIYNQNDILIMDNNNKYKEKIDIFINTRTNTFNSEILEKYQIKEWIKTFV